MSEALLVALIVGLGPTLIGVAQLIAVLIHAKRDRADHRRARVMLAENTAISANAFHEANTVNVKLETLGLAHNEAGKAQAEAMERLTEAIEKKKE